MNTTVQSDPEFMVKSWWVNTRHCSNYLLCMGTSEALRHMRMKITWKESLLTASLTSALFTKSVRNCVTTVIHSRKHRWSNWLTDSRMSDISLTRVTATDIRATKSSWNSMNATPPIQHTSKGISIVTTMLHWAGTRSYWNQSRFEERSEHHEEVLANPLPQKCSKIYLIQRDRRVSW